MVYRDLKPENVMLHADGYVRIVDFGFAKRVETRTYTVCGTPEYLAPEMLMMRGHSHGVDWWALGVLLYEMVVGLPAFCFHPETKQPEVELEPPLLYKNILNPLYELPLPSRLMPETCEMIEALLAFDPLTRIGCLTSGAADVMAQPFFRSVNWVALERRELPPPYMPPPFRDGHLDGLQPPPSTSEPFLEAPIAPVPSSEGSNSWLAGWGQPAWDADF